MKTYKFSRNKQYSIQNTILVMFGAIIVCYMFFLMDDFSLLHSIVYAITVLLSGYYTKKLIKLSRFQFTEIIVYEQRVKLGYENYMKSDVVLMYDEFRAEIIEDKLEFYKNDTNEFLGRVFKDRLKKPNTWDELLTDFGYEI